MVEHDLTVAAIVGDGRGVPIALRIDRWAREESQRRQEDADDERLSKALKALKVAIERDPGIRSWAVTKCDQTGGERGQGRFRGLYGEAS